MMNYSLCLLMLGYLACKVNALPATTTDDAKKTDQPMRPKVKRAQEMLMFGNQQNRQSETAGNPYVPVAEKRALSSSGLDGLKVALSENEKFNQGKTPGNGLYDSDGLSPYEKNYEYGKVLVNELGDEMPRLWDIPPYSRYYMHEELRRKRSEKPTTTNRPNSVPSTTTAFPATMSTQQQQPAIQTQMKKNMPISVYPEHRYKRESEIDPQVLTLLSLWEKERMNRPWRNYPSEEYENIDDDNDLMEDEEARNNMAWLDGPYPPHHYTLNTLASSNIGIPRNHPTNYYEQYGPNQYGQPYEGAIQYGTAQYGALYPQHTYYPQEKRFVVARKRSQAYDPYESLAQLQMSSQPRGYANYPHRMVY
ncbi:prohormone-2-like [Prorops nasuta]|uniref:prohormone-2-like n=1 Tax=Prorops nasuta TaxID=863751 RepID=UPI0034CD6AFE